MKGIIFDFNGTMFKDSDKHEKAWQLYVKKHFGRTPDRLEILEHVQGRSTREILSHFYERPVDREEAEKLGEEKRLIYNNLCLADEAGFKLVYGLEGFLNKYAGILPMTIATASRKVSVDFYFDSFGLERWFETDGIVYDDGTLPGKPNPEIFLLGAQKLGLSINDCIIVEDSLTGLIGAYNAKPYKIIAMEGTLTEREIKKLPNISHIIKDFSNFEQVIF